MKTTIFDTSLKIKFSEDYKKNYLKDYKILSKGNVTRLQKGNRVQKSFGEGEGRLLQTAF